MTSHEYCDYIDSQPDCIVLDDRYHEDLLCFEQQIQDEREMQEAYEAALRRQGAIEALQALKEKLDGAGTLAAALYWIEEGLKDLETPVEAGGTFPPGYFDGVLEALDSLTIRSKGGVL